MERNMKKKLAIMCIMGAAIVGMTACGSKSEDSDSEAALATEASDGVESETETEIEWVSDREDYVNIEDIEVDQYLTLGDYKNMSVSAIKPESDDDTIESYINNYLLVGEVTDRAVKSGDTVNIDYEGKLDGEAFSGGTAQGYNLVIGSGSFISGFEDGLIGVMPGETIDLTLTFPEDYSATDLAGKETVFTVTVNYIIATAEYSTVTVDDMKSMGLSYESLDELWAAGKAAIDESNEDTFNSNAKSAILTKLVDESEATALPQWLVDEQQQYYMLYLEEMVKMYYGVDFETYVTTYIGETMEEAEAEILEECEDAVKNFLVVEAVAREEGIALPESEVDAQAQLDSEYYGYESVDDFLKYVGYSTYRMSLLQDKVMDRLVDIVEVIPETATE
jgi:trigger factor